MDAGEGFDVRKSFAGRMSQVRTQTWKNQNDNKESRNLNPKRFVTVYRVAGRISPRGDQESGLMQERLLRGRHRRLEDAGL